MTDHRSDPRLGALAAGGGLAFLVLAFVQLTNPAFDGVLTTTADYVNDGSFVAALLLTIAGLVALRLLLAAPLNAARFAVTGQALISVGVAAGLVSGESPGWFAAVGVPGVLATLIGTVWLGVWAWRSRALPRAAAVGLGLIVPAGIIAADLGGPVIPGLLWLWLGARIAGTRAAPAASSAGQV